MTSSSMRAGALPALLAAEPAQPDAPGKLADDLAPPVQIMAGDKPIDVTVGHAAPFLHDMNGDGKRDLLVGQFGDGILWIYRNEGSNARPKLAAGVKFKDGKADGRVPTG